MSSEKVLVIDLNENGEYQELLAGRPQTRTMRSGRVCLLAGQSCGRHSTNNCEEMLVFLSGQGMALIGEENRRKVGQGKVVYIPPHTVHNMKNTGTEPLIYIYCVADINGQLTEKKPNS